MENEVCSAKYLIMKYNPVKMLDKAMMACEIRPTIKRAEEHCSAL
jgi:hypothetical protein